MSLHSELVAAFNRVPSGDLKQLAAAIQSAIDAAGGEPREFTAGRVYAFNNFR